jgi:hypothetical protein
MAAPVDTGVKDSRHRGVHVDEQVTGVGSASARDPPDQAETTDTCEASVSDTALVSGRTRAIHHDGVYSLLTECLQDVSSIVFTLHLVVIY